MSKTYLSTHKLPFSCCVSVHIHVTTLIITIFLTSVAYAAEVRNEKIAPQSIPTRVVSDTPEVERLKKLVAFEVAEEAKKQVTSWAKWIIAPVALALAGLGIKTYFDVQTSIKKALEKFQEDSAKASSEAINQFQEDSVKVLNDINEKANQALEVIDQQTSKVKSFADENIGIMSASLTRKSKSNLRRMIYDAENKQTLPGKLVRSEGDSPSEDKDVNELYGLLGITYEFFLEVFNCDVSKDSDLIATVNFSESCNNAFWNGDQLVIGDVDGTLFQTFILLDIVVAEVSKKLMQKLPYKGESGSLRNHLSDVFAVLAVQWNKKQNVEDADWLVGKGILTSSVSGQALRSVREPGTAYNDPVLGKDPQPMHFKDKYQGSADNGGIHINSGIPNRAFYMVATELGGYAWDKAGKIWYKSMMQIEEKDSRPSFLEFAQETYKVASFEYGKESREQEAVRHGWESVGLVIPLDL
jgi:Zn-dependent metalloprotease